MKYDVKKEKIAIHCPTKELAEKVIDKFIELGVEIKATWWPSYEEETCFRAYYNVFGYEKQYFYQENGYKIITAQDYLDSFEWIPKRGEMVMTEYGRSIFIADLGEQIKYRYILVMSGQEERYLRGERVSCVKTDSIQQINPKEPTLNGKTALIDGKEYELKLIEK